LNCNIVLFDSRHHSQEYSDLASYHAFNNFFHYDDLLRQSKIYNIEPWPIFIEDYHGRTHEVILTPGDMLFYESSKCFHGRPKKFHGSWYSSVFVHYYPLHGWKEIDHKMEAHYAIPPSWAKRPGVDYEEDPGGAAAPGTQKFPKLEMIGTSMIEPGCPNEWCRTMDTVQWSGPGEAGVWIAPTLERYPFEPQEVVWNEEL
jgi:hypothetical protein